MTFGEQILVNSSLSSGTISQHLQSPLQTGGGTIVTDKITIDSEDAIEIDEYKSAAICEEDGILITEEDSIKIMEEEKDGIH